MSKRARSTPEFLVARFGAVIEEDVDAFRTEEGSDFLHPLRS